MTKLIFSLLIASIAGYGQYTWHTTTTEFPPPYPQFEGKRQSKPILKELAQSA